MIKLLIILMSMLTSLTTFARDSDWKLCVGDAVLYGDPAKLAMNVFEHRNSTGDGRVTELALIYGGHILRGSFNSSENNSAKVCLRDRMSTYRGLVKVDYENSTVTLDGKMKLPEGTVVNAVLKCETLGN